MRDRRPLTPGEAEIARRTFGGALDPSRAWVAHRKWAFFQPRRVTMAPLGTIHFHPRGGLYRDDFAAAPIALQGLFVHELVHVWQHQQGMFLPIARHPFCRYAYRLERGRPFHAYGLEQQAEIVRHVFLLRAGENAPGAPKLAELLEILPFAADR